MAKSTYYFEINKVDAVESRKEELLNEIKDIFKEHIRKIWGQAYPSGTFK